MKREVKRGISSTVDGLEDTSCLRIGFVCSAAAASFTPAPKTPKIKKTRFSAPLMEEQPKHEAHSPTKAFPPVLDADLSPADRERESVWVESLVEECPKIF